MPVKVKMLVTHPHVQEWIVAGESRMVLSSLSSTRKGAIIAGEKVEL
jgi:hypothetical protein